MFQLVDMLPQMHIMGEGYLCICRPVIDAFTSCLDKVLCRNRGPRREYDDHSDRFFMHSFDTSEVSRWRSALNTSYMML